MIPKSALGRLNFFLLQWWFMRLAHVYYEDMPEVSIGWKILKGVIPLTGWWSSYRYLPGFRRSGT